MRKLVRCEPREERASRGLDDRTKSDLGGSDDVISDVTVPPRRSWMQRRSSSATANKIQMTVSL